MACGCSCHQPGAKPSMCICCADGGVNKWLEPASNEDKSADILKALFKKEPQCPVS